MVDFPKLADNMIVVCFGTESWVRDHDKLTEIGIATFDLRDMRTFKSPGMHGDSLLKQVYFYHARIEENAHVINIKYCPGDLDSNCFGQTRFANFSDATKMVESIFKLSFDAEYPELGFCPVIVMGHALSGDLAMLSRTLGVHAAVFDTVVSIIDTQQLCRETCSWTYHNLANLQKLVSEANFHYRDTHTACNDAAMTLICAVHMVLPSELKTNASGNSTDGVSIRTGLGVLMGTASAAVDEPMFLATQIRPHAVPRCSATTVVPPRLRTTGKLCVIMRRRTVSSLRCVVPR
ncbi:hypothetical protein HBI80_146350 [Parastagonospora nodorum]|nr:hypothetical protein HBI80_146350 [Parastagonospora nodorum]KAH4961412.1 hypothetical protein HBI78_146320 [Parastagonospora nodorum]KAH5197525.1 hypothetical protein HBH77_140070 [Parastagonospora nodorum]KAH5728615.1 hypothetical protein HBI18_108030 [Parastagonospora nodorum]KAH6079643.1 hypothetical protein HBI65_217740 [Parastagonospora nodorum]